MQTCDSLKSQSKGTESLSFTEVKLLGITVQGQYLRGRFIGKSVARVGRGFCNTYVLVASCTIQFIQTLLLSHLSYCSVICSFWVSFC